MEFRPSPLPDPEENAHQPEWVEGEQDPLKEKVESWIKEYESTHSGIAEKPYEVSEEVKEWFAGYKSREEELKASDLDRNSWIEAKRKLTQEYEEKVQSPEYELLALQIESQNNRDKAERNESRIGRLQRFLSERAEEQWWEEYAEEIPPRNLRTHFNETATAMADIEGSGWASYQDKDDYSLLAALHYIEAQQKSSSLPNHSYYGIEVYGDGGFNRWFVDGSGAVRFSKHHASGLDKEKMAKKVERRGFGVS